MLWLNGPGIIWMWHQSFSSSRNTWINTFISFREEDRSLKTFFLRQFLPLDQRFLVWEIGQIEGRGLLEGQRSVSYVGKRIGGSKYTVPDNDIHLTTRLHQHHGYTELVSPFLSSSFSLSLYPLGEFGGLVCCEASNFIYFRLRLQIEMLRKKGSDRSKDRYIRIGVDQVGHIPFPVLAEKALTYTKVTGGRRI